MIYKAIRMENKIIKRKPNMYTQVYKKREKWGEQNKVRCEMNTYIKGSANA